MSQCCGKGSVESLLDKFKVVNASFNQKQHPHTSSTTTIQATNSFITSTSNNTILTKHGFLKYTGPQKS